MGAVYDSYECRVESDGDALFNCAAYIQRCLWEDGHSPYSGTMGSNYGQPVITGRTFDSVSDAHDWLEDNVEKRGNILGVVINGSPDDKLTHYVFGALCGW